MSETALFDFIVLVASALASQALKKKGFSDSPSVGPFGTKSFSIPRVIDYAPQLFKFLIKLIERKRNGSSTETVRPVDTGYQSLLPQRELLHVADSYYRWMLSAGPDSIFPFIYPRIGGRSDVSYVHRTDGVPAFFSVFSGWNGAYDHPYEVNYSFNHLATEITGMYFVKDLLLNHPWVLTYGVIFVDRDLSVGGSNYLDYFTADMHPRAGDFGVQILCSERIILPAVLSSVTSEGSETFSVYRLPFLINVVLPFDAYFVSGGGAPSDCRFYFFTLMTPTLGSFVVPADTSLSIHFNTCGYLPPDPLGRWTKEY